MNSSLVGFYQTNGFLFSPAYRMSHQNVHDWNQIFNRAPFKWFQIRAGGRGPSGQIFAPILWVKSEQTQVLLKKIRVKAHKFATNSESCKRYISGTDMECYKNVYIFNWPQSLLSEMRVKMEGRKATKYPKCKKISYSVCQISQKFWAHWWLRRVVVAVDIVVGEGFLLHTSSPAPVRMRQFKKGARWGPHSLQ